MKGGNFLVASRGASADNGGDYGGVTNDREKFLGWRCWEEKIACTTLSRSPFKITKLGFRYGTPIYNLFFQNSVGNSNFDFLSEYSSKSAKVHFPSEYFKIQNF